MESGARSAPGGGRRARPEESPRQAARGKARYNDVDDDWREHTGSWAAEPDTSSWVRDPDTGQWSRSDDDPRVQAWREEAARRETPGPNPSGRRELPAAPAKPESPRQDPDDWRTPRGGDAGPSSPRSAMPAAPRSAMPSAPRSATPYGPGADPSYPAAPRSGTPYGSPRRELPSGRARAADDTAFGSAPTGGPAYDNGTPGGPTYGGAPGGPAYGSARRALPSGRARAADDTAFGSAPSGGPAPATGPDYGSGGPDYGSGGPAYGSGGYGNASAGGPTYGSAQTSGPEYGSAQAGGPEYGSAQAGGPAYGAARRELPSGRARPDDDQNDYRGRGPGGSAPYDDAPYDDAPYDDSPGESSYGGRRNGNPYGKGPGNAPRSGLAFGEGPGNTPRGGPAYGEGPSNASRSGPVYGDGPLGSAPRGGTAYADGPGNSPRSGPAYGDGLGNGSRGDGASYRDGSGNGSRGDDASYRDGSGNGSRGDDASYRDGSGNGSRGDDALYGDGSGNGLRGGTPYGDGPGSASRGGVPLDGGPSDYRTGSRRRADEPPAGGGRRRAAPEIGYGDPAGTDSWRHDLDDGTNPSWQTRDPGAGPSASRQARGTEAPPWSGGASPPDARQPGDWRLEFAERPESDGRGSAPYREGGGEDWRQGLADDSSNLGEGESRRYGTSDFVPFRSSGAASVPRASNLSMTSTSLISPVPREQRDPMVRPQRSGNGLQESPSGSYERRPVTGGFPTSRRSDLLDPDDEEDDQDSGGLLAAIGYTVIWYGVPIVLFVVYMLVIDSGSQSHALGTLGKAAPQFLISLVLSVLVALGLRRFSSSWKAISVGLAAAVVGAGLATVLSSAITGNSLS
jgi:hypothetical protein